MDKQTKDHQDIIQWATLPEISTTIHALDWPTASYMYLERIPTMWLTDVDVQTGLCLRHLDLATVFDQYERGRIFCTNFELCWEKQQGQFQAVYTGKQQTLASFQLDPSVLNQTERDIQHYYLWGTKVQEEDIDLIGATPADDEQAFVALRIPRILYYPVSGDASRVQLQVCAYVKAAAVVYYRFQKLVEVPKDEKGIDA